MRKAERRYLTLVVVLAAALTVATAPLAGATTPGPVIPVEKPDGPPPPEKWQEVLPDEIPPGQDDPTSDDEPGPLADHDCFVGGPRPLPGVATGTTGLPLLLAGYPGPVVAVKRDPAAPPCTTELNLSLKVESPKNEKPDGASATVASRWLVPRRSLEAGARSEMPAASIPIRFKHPGEEWEIKSVACTCQGQPTGATALSSLGLSGPTPVGQAAAYPGPVLPVPSGGAQSGSTRCQGATAGVGAVSVMAAPGGGTMTRSQSTTAYPGPVLPVKPTKDGTQEPAPAPKARKPGSVGWESNGDIRIEDPWLAGAIVECTWTVEHVFGRVKVRNVTKPEGSEHTIDFTAAPTSVEGAVWPRRIQGSAAGEEHLLRNGEWSLTPGNVVDGWEFVKSSCQESDSGKRTVAGGTDAQLGVDVGDDITCTYEWKLITPKEGPWKAVNKAGKATCSAKGGGSVTIGFGQDTGVGRIVHRQDGDRLDMKGRGQGLIPVRVDRDPDDPRRYRGSTQRTFSGAKARFKFEYKVVSEKRMTGSLTTTWKQGGNSCVFTRKVTLTYAGK